MGIGDVRPCLVVGSANPGKAREIAVLLGGLGGIVESLKDHPPVDFPEEGTDYLANAIAKARAVADQLGVFAIADDSGLEVDALDGRPGPLSARYGGPDLDDAGRVTRLLGELQGTPPEGRGARFVCLAAFAAPDGSVETAKGICEGRILERPRGTAGFGYDPIFQPEGDSRSMAELSPSEKHQISHRGQALRTLTPTIRKALVLAP